MKLLTLLALVLTLAALAGCPKKEEPVEPVHKPGRPEARAPAVEDFATDAWLGKWVGVEGLVLVIDRGAGPGTYNLTISTMDGTTKHVGTADNTRIRFERSGTEYIHAGKGSDTGLKWLADKNNCLIIKEGEGFCR